MFPSYFVTWVTNASRMLGDDNGDSRSYKVKIKCASLFFVFFNHCYLDDTQLGKTSERHVVSIINIDDLKL